MTDFVYGSNARLHFHSVAAEWSVAAAIFTGAFHPTACTQRLPAPVRALEKRYWAEQIRFAGDNVVADNWFGNAANQLEIIRSGDGKALAVLQVQALVTAMAAFNPAGQMTLPADCQAAVQPVMASSRK